MTEEPRRIILVDPDHDGREVLAGRLRGQGFVVETAADGASGAELALAAPPSAVIADLWMPGISGVQLCRLLRAEPATADVPFILRAENDDPKSRFWAERAGAVALVSKGRMGELVRILRRVASAPAPDSAFFMQLGSGVLDVRDRIAAHLDTALFESVVAAEVRALASACSFDGVFDSLSQLLSQLMSYHWLALSTPQACLAVHGHPDSIDATVEAARAALGIEAAVQARLVQDKDALPLTDGSAQSEVVVRDVPFAGSVVARIAVASTNREEAIELVELVARELGGAVRLATLVEESRRLAATDALTGLANRRTFVAAVAEEAQRCESRGSDLCILLLDVDHFKQVNDRFGHASGDTVLAAMGRLLPDGCRSTDIVARWGGEEFVAALPDTTLENALMVAERLRAAVQATIVHGVDGTAIPISVSIGVALRSREESQEALLDRADRAMYAAKSGGRNRVCADREPAPLLASRPAPSHLRAIA